VVSNPLQSNREGLSPESRGFYQGYLRLAESVIGFHITGFKSHAFVCTKTDSAEYLVLAFPNIVSGNRSKSCLFESALKPAEIMEKLMTKLPEGVVDNKTRLLNPDLSTNAVNVPMNVCTPAGDCSSEA